MYGVQAAAGLGKLGFGLHQAGLAREKEMALRSAGLPQMSTAQEYFDLYQNASRSKQFEQEKAMTQSVLASNLATLQGAGSRAVIGGAGAAQLTAQRGMAEAAEADFKRQQAALESLAAAQQQTELYNFNTRSRQYATDLASAQEGFTSGIETAVSGADQAVGSTAMMLREFGDNRRRRKVDDSPDPRSGGYFDIDGNEVSVKPGSEGDYFTYDPTSVTRDSTPFGYRGSFGQGSGFNVNAPTVPGPMSFGGVPFNDPVTNAVRTESAGFDVQSAFPTGNPPAGTVVVPEGGYSTQQEASFKNPGVEIRRGSDGFFYPVYAQGGSVTTPGKYTADHSVEYDVKTKGGKIIATVTGDETLVFNPKQRRFLKKVIGRLLKGQNVQLGKNETKTAKQTLKAFEK